MVRRRIEPRPHRLALALSDTAMIKEQGKAPPPASNLPPNRAWIDPGPLPPHDRSFGATLSRETVTMERVERAKAWYRAHLHARPSLKTLADAVQLSVAHLRREFHAAHGKSPHAVLIQLRVERASQLLANGGDTLAVIAKQSGFNSASDLCRVFKRQLKRYPNEWRTQVAGQAVRESKHPPMESPPVRR